jgi:hypothetical protein
MDCALAATQAADTGRAQAGAAAARTAIVRVMMVMIVLVIMIVPGLILMGVVTIIAGAGLDCVRGLLRQRQERIALSTGKLPAPVIPDKQHDKRRRQQKAQENSDGTDRHAWNLRGSQRIRVSWQGY